MPRLTAALTILSFSTALVSCQKEASFEIAGNSPTSSTSGALSPQSIQGNYKFISLKGSTKSSVEQGSGNGVEKQVTTSDFITENNSGTIKFDASNVSSNQLAYGYNALINAYFYKNGLLDDSLSTPFHFEVPVSSSTVPYKFVGSDSLYFGSGSMFISGATQPTMPSGAKVRMEGDKLYLTMSINQSNSANLQGSTVVTAVQATMTVTMQRL